MALLERVVYKSSSTSVADVLAYGSEEILVGAASVAFVRSGFFTERGQSAIVDMNYVVAGGPDECLVGGVSNHICACTIVTYAGLDRPPLPPGCSPTSSRAFFLHARLLTDARLHRGDPDSEAQGLLYEMRGAVQAPHACAHSHLVNEIRRLINEQPFKRVSLESLAHRFYMSPFSVSRVFHRETGMRLRDYTVRLRLRKALNLLIHSRKSLTGVAIDLGFYDEPHFSKAFRSEFGISPQSVRKYCTRSDFS